MRCSIRVFDSNLSHSCVNLFGTMLTLETARDGGRKHGVMLMMVLLAEEETGQKVIFGGSKRHQKWSYARAQLRR